MKRFFYDLWKFLRCLGMRFWYEAVMSRHSAAFRAKTSSCCCSSDSALTDLLLFHSYDCLSLAHPTLSGASSRSNLLNHVFTFRQRHAQFHFRCNKMASNFRFRTGFHWKLGIAPKPFPSCWVWWHESQELVLCTYFG